MTASRLRLDAERLAAGNTGRADVPLRQRMAVPDDLAPLVGSG